MTRSLRSMIFGFGPADYSLLIAVAVFSFVGHWSDFFGPLVYLNSPDNFTMVLGTTIAVMSARA